MSANFLSGSCFWCKLPLTEENYTRDHLISVPLQKFLGWSKRKRAMFLVNCCHNCNNLRSIISNIFCVAIGRQPFNPISAKRNKIYKALKLFRNRIINLISQNANEQVFSYCLEEIDLVLDSYQVIYSSELFGFSPVKSFVSHCNFLIEKNEFKIENEFNYRNKFKEIKDFYRV